MGGTFNPIHNGHLTLAEEAFKQFSLDEVLFMPCGNAYMKADQKVESGQTRSEMTALAIKDKPYFTLSTIEIERKGNTYTYQTLECLKKENPDKEYYFIVGADSLFHMPQWVAPDRIFSNCCVLAAIRDDKTVKDMEEQIDLLSQKYNAHIYIMKTGRMSISSSDIRRKVAVGESIEGDVPESVRIYIEKRGLYK
ncbi:MAG: nicotinate-nucleotide adenylyltransferase [Lachnospiraceae bacterium]|nr:nicotinate-nucleotide adenylyltransferase [Lachnospiraceae bacterium]